MALVVFYKAGFANAAALPQPLLSGGVLSADDGPIAEVLLTLPPDAFDDSGAPIAALEQVLIGLDAALPATTRWQLHAYPEHLDRVRKRFGRRQIMPLPSQFGFYTLWSRDLFIVGRQQDLWYRGADNQRRFDGSVVDEILATGKIAAESRTVEGFSLEGGNLLSNRSRVLIGRDLVLDNYDENAPPLISADHAQHWYWQGGTEWSASESPTAQTNAAGQRQALFHLDMYLTLLPESIATSTVLLAEVNQPEWLRRRLERERQGLIEQGLTVLRLPMATRQEAGQLHIYSYNNVLFEGGESRAVLMPAYGIDDDEAAAGIYRNLGLRVKTVPGFQHFAHLLGSLRCMVQVTRRGRDVSDNAPKIPGFYPSIHSARRGAHSGFRELTSDRSP